MRASVRSVAFAVGLFTLTGCPLKPDQEVREVVDVQTIEYASAQPTPRPTLAGLTVLVHTPGPRERQIAAIVAAAVASRNASARAAAEGYEGRAYETTAYPTDDGTIVMASTGMSAAAASDPTAAPVPTATTALPLYWNARAAEGRPRQPGAKPAHPLNPKNKKYRIFVDLSRQSDDLPVGATVSAPALSPILEAEAARLSNRIVTLRVLVLPDTRAFALASEREQEFEVDLGAAPEDCAANTAAPRSCRLGGFHFDVVTKPMSGPAEIALSIWIDDRPIDEPVIRLCLNSTGDCEPGVRQRSAAPRVLSHTGAPPDVALHFIELDRRSSRAIQGVLQLLGTPPLTWELQEGVDAMRAKLGSLIASAGEAILYPDEPTLRRHGEALYAQIFPSDREDSDNKIDSDPERAGRALADYFNRALAAPGERPKPRVLVRMIALDSHEPLFLPFGVIALPSKAGKESTRSAEPARDDKGEGRGLGPVPLAQHTRLQGATTDSAAGLLGLLATVEIPLPEQVPADPQRCIDTWHLVAPALGGADPTLDRAVGNLGHFRELNATRHTSLRAFDAYLASANPQPSAAYVVLSHHDHDKLKFGPGDAMAPGAVQSVFSNPSVIILNGCETAGTGMAGFVQRFDQLHVNAVIGTATTLPPRMAGQYLDCLARQFPDTSTELTLWDAHRQAIDCLRAEDDGGKGKVGARVALYQLVGDGSVRLCPSRRAAPPAEDGWFERPEDLFR